jgi:hypothetical protein
MNELLDEAIEYVGSRLTDYQNPGSYQEKEWYIRCSAKADMCEEILYNLKQLRDRK